MKIRICEPAQNIRMIIFILLKYTFIKKIFLQLLRCSNILKLLLHPEMETINKSAKLDINLQN